MSDMDTTTPGGTYIVDGVVVGADGKALEGWTVDKKGNAVPPKDSKPAADEGTKTS